MIHEGLVQRTVQLWIQSRALAFTQIIHAVPTPELSESEIERNVCQNTTVMMSSGSAWQAVLLEHILHTLQLN